MNTVFPDSAYCRIARRVVAGVTGRRVLGVVVGVDIGGVAKSCTGGVKAIAGGCGVGAGVSIGVVGVPVTSGIDFCDGAIVAAAVGIGAGITVSCGVAAGAGLVVGIGELHAEIRSPTMNAVTDAGKQAYLFIAFIFTN